MNKKKLIKKIALPAAVVFVASITIAMLMMPYMDTVYEKHLQRLDQHIANLTEQNQKDLDEIALKIQPLVEQVQTRELGKTRLVRELESQFLAENQKVEQPKKYLWLSADDGEFIFGAPNSVFQRLNTAYDKNSEDWIKSGLFKDRNDFLLKVVDQHHKINFDNFDTASLHSQLRRDRKTGLVLSIPGFISDSWYYVRERSILLSTPLTTESGNVLGTLFLKVDDSVNHELYYKKNPLENSIFVGTLTPFFIFFAVISGIFLWFLLPTWVYIDAQQRDVSNPGIWAFITLVSLIFGLAIYLITRPSTLKSFHCPQCENEVNGGAFCPHCGFDLASTMCPQCQYPIKSEWAFCPSCRAELRQSIVSEQIEESPEEEKK